VKDPELINDFELTTVKDIPVLFSFEMLDMDNLPQGIFGYTVAYDEDDWLTPVSLCKGLTDNFFGVVISKTPLPIEANGILPIDHGMDLCLINSGSYSIEQYLKLNKEEYDNARLYPNRGRI